MGARQVSQTRQVKGSSRFPSEVCGAGVSGEARHDVLRQNGAEVAYALCSNVHVLNHGKQVL
jgi:hypothetical protein